MTHRGQDARPSSGKNLFTHNGEYSAGTAFHVRHDADITLSTGADSIATGKTQRLHVNDVFSVSASISIEQRPVNLSPVGSDHIRQSITAPSYGASGTVPSTQSVT